MRDPGNNYDPADAYRETRAQVRNRALRESDFARRQSDDGTRTWVVVWQGSELKIVKFGTWKPTFRAIVNNVPLRRQSADDYTIPFERRFRTFAGALAAIKRTIRDMDAAPAESQAEEARRLGGRL